MLRLDVLVGAVPHPATWRPALYLWQSGCSLQQKSGRGLLQTGASGECDQPLYASVYKFIQTTEKHASTFAAAMMP